MTGTLVSVLLFVALCSAKPRERTDNDGYHPYFMPDAGSTPEAWRDWINPPGSNYEDWFDLGQAELDRALKQVSAPIVKPAKNVIVFVGDGMGISTVSAARIYRAQTQQLKGDDAYLSFEKLPYAGLSRTYATDQIVPDSANTATALFCGVKCRDGVLGASQEVLRGNCSTLAGNEVDSVLRKAIEENGMVAGVVSTHRVTHATPASTYCHSANRDWEADGDLEEEDRRTCEDIASQLVREERNQNIRVVLGGGRQKFLTINDTDPEYPEMMGHRLDNNLLDEWTERRKAEGLKDEQFAIVFNQTDFDAVDPETTVYLMGLFEPSQMQWESDREDPAHNKWAEPSLAEMTEKAIRILSKHEDGYFLMVEGALIDSAHHENLAQKALVDTVAFQDAVAKALELTDEQETLILATADHSHVFTMAGYGASNSDILGYDDELKPMIADDKKLYTTLGYTNGPGYDLHRKNMIGEDIPRRNLTEFNITDKEFIYDAGVQRYSETHGGEDVGVWASGPMAHLVHTSHEQSYFAHLQMYALCVGPRKDLCDAQPTEPPTGAAPPTVRATPTARLLLVAAAAVTMVQGVLRGQQ